MLHGSFPSDPAVMTAPNESPPQPSPAAGDGPKTWVYLTNATRTSADAGPGSRELPAAEASALVAVKLAVPGDQPPRGWPG
jgi:hypothetical protein